MRWGMHWMCRWATIAVILFCSPTLSWAQGKVLYNATTDAAGGTGTLALSPQYNSVLVEVTIAGTATVSFTISGEGAQPTAVACTDYSSTSFAAATSATATGTYLCPTSGASGFQISVGAHTGAVRVYASPSAGSARRGGGGGGAGTVTSVSASGGVETTSGSAITGSGTIRGNMCVRAVTGTTDTILSTDRGCLVTYSNASAIAVTLPQAGTAGFDHGFSFTPLNLGAGTVTITPTTSTIQGSTDIDLTTNKSVGIVSDGTNYFYAPGIGLTVESQGLDDVIAVDRTYGGAVSQATAPRFGATATGRFFVLFDDPTTGLTLDCEVATVLGDCDKGVKIYTGHVFNFKNNSGTAIGTLTESTGAWTNTKIDGEGSGNTITLTEESWFDLVACQGSTASHIWNTITATFPAAACDTGSNTQKGYASFDASTDEAIQMDWVLPTGFTGAIDIHFIWKAAATSGAVGWCAQLIRVADASTSDPAFPAQAAGNCVSDTAKGTTLQENHATISGVTCTSCAARDHVYVRISRDANGGAVTDDMTGDAHLMKVGRTWRVAH